MRSIPSVFFVVLLAALTACSAPLSDDAATGPAASSASSSIQASKQSSSRASGMRTGREAPAAKEVPGDAGTLLPPSGKHIGMQVWPPEIKREPYEGGLDCEAFRIDARITAPFPTVSEITLLGEPACKLHGDEGAAGSRYITDRYILVKDGEKITVDLVVRQESCGALDPEDMMPCGTGQSEFWDVYNPEALVTGVLKNI